VVHHLLHEQPLPGDTEATECVRLDLVTNAARSLCRTGSADCQLGHLLDPWREVPLQELGEYRRVHTHHAVQLWRAPREKPYLQISFELCEQGQRLLPDLAARVLETVQLRSQPVRVTAEDVVDALLGMPNPFLLVTLGLLVQL